MPSQREVTTKKSRSRKPPQRLIEEQSHVIVETRAAEAAAALKKKAKEALARKKAEEANKKREKRANTIAKKKIVKSSKQALPKPSETLRTTKGGKKEKLKPRKKPLSKPAVASRTAGLKAARTAASMKSKSKRSSELSKRRAATLPSPSTFSAPAPAIFGGFGASTPAIFGGFGASTSGAARAKIDARTDIDLTGYNYGSEPPSSSHTTGQLDLVFCLDCTGSMGSVIRACQTSIVQIATTLMSAEGQDVRFSLIPYRDHSVGEEYCTKVYPFTRDLDQMQKNVNAQSANGGGDSPEAVTAAMFEAVCLDWRENAAKLVVFMADAGPHGLGEGYSFPEGDPDGKDPLAIAREMEGLGIAAYALVSGGSQKTRYFFASLAAMTGGQCIPLADANLLGDAILGGARENVDIEQRMSALRAKLDEAVTLKGSALTEEEAAEVTKQVLTSSGSKPRAMPLDKVVSIPREYLDEAQTAESIVDLRGLWDKRMGTGGGGGFGFGGGFTFGAASSTSSSAAPAAPAKSAEEAIAERMSKMATARGARATDPVMIECVADGKKVRARVISPGYSSSKNVQFPRDIRKVGQKFLVDAVVNAGSFYRVKGNIVPV